jgi:hypothetical protein|tara:strand:+ start:2698 stop:3462 length:765 start_codon:yes stop_codon:yes gene_type:complete
VLTYRSVILSLCLLLAASFPAHANEDPELQRILKAHVDAMGGWRAWNKVESIRLTGTIEREGQLFDYCLIKKRTDKIRMTITMPLPGEDKEEVQLIRAFDGEYAWTATRLAGADDYLKQELLGIETAIDLASDANVMPQLMSYIFEGHYFTLEESDDYTGHTINCYPDRENKDSFFQFHICAQNYTVDFYHTVLAEAIVSTTTHLSYETKNDLQIPNQLLVDAAGTGSTTMLIDSIELGVGIYDAYFSPLPIQQ